MGFCEAAEDQGAILHAHGARSEVSARTSKRNVLQRPNIVAVRDGIGSVLSGDCKDDTKRTKLPVDAVSTTPAAGLGLSDAPAG